MDREKDYEFVELDIPQEIENVDRVVAMAPIPCIP
jgi:hypothetical protein